MRIYRQYLSKMVSENTETKTSPARMQPDKYLKTKDNKPYITLKKAWLAVLVYYLLFVPHVNYFLERTGSCFRKVRILPRQIKVTVHKTK